MALVDIDDFKSINDERGHLAGDQVLRLSAERTRAAVRSYDAVGRYGGDAFLIVLSETNADTAKKACERVRHRVAQGNANASEVMPPVTTSVGVALGTGDDLPEFERLRHLAAGGERVAGPDFVFGTPGYLTPEALWDLQPVERQ